MIDTQFLLYDFFIYSSSTSKRKKYDSENMVLELLVYYTKPLV